MKNNTLSLRKALAIVVLFSGMFLPQLAHAFNPCIDLIKEVSADGGITWYDANTETDAVVITSGATYKFTVKACDPLAYYLYQDILVSDDVLQVSQSLPDMQVYFEGEGNNDGQNFTVTAPGICDGIEGSLLNTATVTATGVVSWAQTFVIDSDDAWIRCEPSTGGGDGCTPGYWKQTQHFDSYPDGITPDTLFSSIFDRVIKVRTRAGVIENPTLLQALSARGGQVNRAARHATAAYLNAATSDVSYDLSESEVIALLQSSIDNNDYGSIITGLADFNEQGCPLN